MLHLESSLDSVRPDDAANHGSASAAKHDGVIAAGHLVYIPDNSRIFWKDILTCYDLPDRVIDQHFASRLHTARTNTDQASRRVREDVDLE